MDSRGYTKSCWVAVVLVVAGLSQSFAVQVDGAKVLAETGLSAGLCVVVGTSDGKLEATLAADGRILVHGLALDEAALRAARSEIESRGLYGVASVEPAPTLPVLPYAENMANVLVADLEALGSRAPSEEEIMRVVVPLGYAYTRVNGVWSATRKPMPSEMDEWRQTFHDETNNPLSHDKLVKPPTSLKWLAWYANYSNNAEGLHGKTSQEYRLAGGRAFQQLSYKPTAKITNYIDARDAFNGVSLWLRTSAIMRDACRPIATESHYFVPYKVENRPANVGPLVALSSSTGEIGHSYFGYGDTRYHPLHAVLHKGYMALGSGDTLRWIDTATQQVKWEHVEGPGKGLIQATVSEGENRLYVVVAKDSVYKLDGRNKNVRAQAVIALDLSSGSRVWSCTDFVGKGGGVNQYPLVTELLVLDQSVILWGDGSYADPVLMAIRKSDAKVRWLHNYQFDTTKVQSTYPTDFWYAAKTSSYFPVYPKTGEDVMAHSCVYRDGLLWVLAKYMALGFDPATGLLSRKFKAGSYGKCNRCFATDNYFILGYGTFVDRDLNFQYFTINRGTCASGHFPGYGQSFVGPNGECGCFVALGYASAVSSEPLQPELDVSQRLEMGPAGLTKSSGAQQGTIATGRREAAGNRGETFGTRPPVISGKPVRDDWNNNDYFPYPNTDTLVAGSRIYYAVVNEHRIECRESNGALVWTFTAGGRISRAPVLHDGRLLFGSHDGYAYCLRPTDGRMVWRFMAGRNHRRITAFSQLESSWPVYGVIIHDGKACFTAGHHPQIDGGIHAWGLDPATGSVTWHSVVRDDPPLLANKSKFSERNKVINTVLTSDGTNVSISGFSWDPTLTRVGGAASARKAGRTPVIRVAGKGIVIDLGAGADAKATVQLTNLKGQTVLTHEHFAGATTRIPLSVLGRGMYAVTVKIDGRGTYTGGVRIQ